ncbi:hypothetical protein [Desulfonema ishimotonii]|uniref:hypothetical protein n=1 Tax=Desulfonema ishimotonii TaxID=45657 RepID=UPI00140BB396|nr:hypothetical protein [Desulfonema ishimotonii]
MEIDSEKAFDDFLGPVGKSSVLAFRAIGSEYTLFRQVDTIAEYERFVCPDFSL